MKIILWIIIAIALIIAGPCINYKKNRDIHLIADHVIGMGVTEGITFIRKTGCTYSIVRNDNLSRILPEQPRPNRIKLYIKNGMILNTTVG